MLEKVITYYGEHKEAYWSAFITHISISLRVILIAAAIGIPLGIFCAKYRRTAKYISGFVNFLRVVPSLALMVILIPIMGIGKVTAMVALTVIAMPAIMINTTAGFLSVEPMVLETARGMGMDAFQVFTRVEVPLAFPLILTGLRTSAVETIASATIASYIGAGGLGDFVYKGLGMNRTEIVLLGGVSIAVFSIVVDILLAIYQGYVGRYLE